jgi:hypothetical protein
LTEQEIAAAVFGRTADFDPTTDTLVRVQFSHLRKRLQLYFSSEGLDEPLLLDLPKGSYLPRFRPRKTPLPEAAQPDAVAMETRVGRPLLVLASMLCVCAAACVWLALDAREASRLRQRLDEGTPRPSVHRLWSQMFGNGQPTTLVLADASLAFFQDLLRRQLSLAEYQNAQFHELARRELRGGLEQGQALRFMNRQFTSVADSRLVRKLALLGIVHGDVEVAHAREMGAQRFRAGRNAVLSGPRRVNPWVELFEERLNFRSRFDEKSRTASFTNTTPAVGEAALYTASWTEAGYCRVAFVSNLDRTGSTLILSGTDMPATDSGVDFLTTERWVRRLLALLGSTDGRSIPHFEILLRTRRVVESSPDFTIVAHRLLP